jgi:hypothetical protein
MRMMITGGSMSIPLPNGGTVQFDINRVNDEYKLYPNDTSKGLLKTQQIFQQDANYKFGDLTEGYEQFPDGGAHWRQSVRTFREIHPVLKSLIIDALTRQPPVEIQWNWDKDARPMGGGVSKGVSVVYDPAAPKYYILIFGYVMPG